MSSDGQQQRDDLEAAIGEAWIAGEWDTAISKAEELTKFDRESGMEFSRISKEHKVRRAGGVFGRKGRAS